MSKTSLYRSSDLEKRDEDQQESQDTKHPLPRIYEENSLEKKFHRHFQDSTVKIICGPHPSLFSPATDRNTFTFTPISSILSEGTIYLAPVASTPLCPKLRSNLSTVS